MTWTKMFVIGLMVVAITYGPAVLTKQQSIITWYNGIDPEVAAGFEDQAQKGIILYTRNKLKVKIGPKDISSLKLTKWDEENSKTKPGVTNGYAIYEGVLFDDGEYAERFGTKYFSKLLTFTKEMRADTYKVTGGKSSIHSIKDNDYKATYAKFTQQATKTLDKPVRVIPFY